MRQKIKTIIQHLKMDKMEKKKLSNVRDMEQSGLSNTVMEL